MAGDGFVSMQCRRPSCSDNIWSLGGAREQSCFLSGLIKEKDGKEPGCTVVLHLPPQPSLFLSKRAAASALLSPPSGSHSLYHCSGSLRKGERQGEESLKLIINPGPDLREAPPPHFSVFSPQLGGLLTLPV